MVFSLRAGWILFVISRCILEAEAPLRIHNDAWVDKYHVQCSRISDSSQMVLCFFFSLRWQCCCRSHLLDRLFCLSSQLPLTGTATEQARAWPPREIFFLSSFLLFYSLFIVLFGSSPRIRSLLHASLSRGMIAANRIEARPLRSFYCLRDCP